MPKRLFWMGTGYATGAASSWWVQRKVKREVEKVLPAAVRNEVTNRVTAVRGRAVEVTTASPIAQTAKSAWNRVRPGDAVGGEIDLTDRSEAPTLSVVDGGLTDEPGIGRLRDRARRSRR